MPSPTRPPDRPAEGRRGAATGRAGSASKGSPRTVDEGATGREYPASYVILSPRISADLAGMKRLLSTPQVWPEEVRHLAAHAAGLCAKGMQVQVVVARPEDVQALHALVRKEGAHRMARRASSGLGVAGLLSAAI